MQEDDIVTVEDKLGFFIIDELVGIWACLTSIENPNLHMTVKQDKISCVTFSSELESFLKETPKPDPNEGGPTKPLTVPKESDKEIV